MRFYLEVALEKSTIPKDKNRAFLSLFKHCLSEYDEDFYNRLYRKGNTNQKDFTFSLYMPECKFLKDEIEIPNKKLMINVSSYNLELAIQFFNAFLENIGKKYEYKGNQYLIEKVKLCHEKTIDFENAFFKTMSPCVAREHNTDNKSTWYYSLNDEKGREIFLKNAKIQAKSNFPDKEKEIEELQFNLLENKDVKVKYYDVVVLANLAKFELIGKPFLLDYFYKAGIASLKSSGFGMIDLL